MHTVLYIVEILFLPKLSLISTSKWTDLRVRFSIHERGGTKPAFADIRFYLSPMLYSVKIKVVNAMTGTKAANCLWFICSLHTQFCTPATYKTLSLFGRQAGGWSCGLRHTFNFSTQSANINIILTANLEQNKYNAYKLLC